MGDSRVKAEVKCVAILPPGGQFSKRKEPFCLTHMAT